MRGGVSLVALVLLVASCGSSIRERARYADSLAKSGDFAKAERAYEEELKQPLAYDEWEYARDGLCKARGERARQLLAGPIRERSDADITALRAEVRRCPSLLALDSQLALVLVGRNIERLDALQPLVDEGKYWEALAAAAPAWAALPPENPKRVWFAELKVLASAQLTARAAEWLEVPMASALLLELAWLAGGGGGPGSGPVALADARLAGRRIASTRRVSPDCGAWIEASSPETTPVPVDPADALIEVNVSACEEILTLVDDTETYTVMEERQVEVQRIEHHERTKSIPVTRNEQKCDTYYDGSRVCNSYAVTTYTTVTETVSVPVTVTVTKIVPVERTRPIKRLRRQRSVIAQVRVRFHDGERTDSVARSHTAIDGRYDASTTQASASPGMFATQNGELQTELFAAAEVATKSLVLARNTQRWRARGQAAQAAGDSQAAVDALLTVNLGNPRAGTEVADFLATSLSLPAGTFNPYAPPNVRDIVQSNKPLTAKAYIYVQPDTLGVLTFGYAPGSLHLGVQSRRGPEIAGQPRRSGVSGIYEVRYDAGGLMTMKPFGFTVYAPLTFRLELGKRTSDPYQYPRTGGIESEEGFWDAGIDTSLGLLAGYRARSFGLFVGATAAYQGNVLGAYRSSSGQLPLSVRFELRRRQRYPVLLDVWGFDVRGKDEFTRGARLEIPLSTNRWFTAGVREMRAESQTRGLDDRDYVALGATSLLSASAGMTFGF